MAVAGRDVALTAPGASQVEENPMALNGESCMVPRAAKNCATLLDMLAWKFVKYGPMSNLRQRVAFF